MRGRFRLIASLTVLMISIVAEGESIKRIPPSAGISEAMRTAIQQKNAFFNTEVVKKGNIDALDEIYAVDARLLPSGAKLTRGRDQIKEFWRHAIADEGIKNVKLTTLEASREGDGILEIGTVELTLANHKVENSKYVVYWIRENATWKWDVDIWNEDQ
jgi:ketosteroid isomerase-like protein